MSKELIELLLDAASETECPNQSLEAKSADLIEAQQKRIELYEQALKASWPEGAMGDAFDYWNAARKEDV